MAEYVVNLIWDEDANVWIATSNDIPGLVLESGSIDALIERVRFAAPELIAMNGELNIERPLLFRSERREKMAG
jgi:hypothetical protein